MNYRRMVLQEAVAEAKRFIDKAGEAISRIDEEENRYCANLKEVAAAKRASMDLTRVLVDVRRAE